MCHVDAAKGMVAWGKDNAAATGLSQAPIRWIVDDCAKFVEREIRRGHKYDAIIWTRRPTGAAPAARSGSWSRTSGPFVSLCAGVLSDEPLFVLINSYTTRAFRVGAQLCDGEHIHKEVRRQQRRARSSACQLPTADCISPAGQAAAGRGMQGNFLGRDHQV